MLYMIEANSTGDWSFITSDAGMLSKDAAEALVSKINRNMVLLDSPTRFYVTPVLDV